MEIDSTKPAPKPNQKGRPRKWDFGKLNIGDSFSMNEAQASYMHQACIAYNKSQKTNIKITVKKEGESQYRCWRVE